MYAASGAAILCTGLGSGGQVSCRRLVRGIIRVPVSGSKDAEATVGRKIRTAR